MGSQSRHACRCAAALCAASVLASHLSPGFLRPISSPSLQPPGRPIGGAQRSLRPGAIAPWPQGPASRVRRLHTPLRTPSHAAPWDFLQGTVVDPNYWKQQYFLAAQLKNFFPPGPPRMLNVLELAPTDAKYLGYMTPGEGGGRLDKYWVLGLEDDELQDKFKQQGQVFKAEVLFAQWEAGKRITNFQKDVVDAALVAPGTPASLGAAALSQGLAEVNRVMKYDARVLIVCNEDDEKVLGGSMESILDVQDAMDLEELEDLQIDDVALSSGQIFKDAGLRLIRAIRDECGLTLGVCVRRELPKVPKSMRKANPRRRPAAPAGKRGRRERSKR